VLSSRMSSTRQPRTSAPLQPARRPRCRPRLSLGNAHPARVPTLPRRPAHFSVPSVLSVVKAFPVLFLRESLASLRLSVILTSCAQLSPIFPCAQLQQNLPLQLQLHAFLRSVDYGGLMWHLTPLRINTSKSFRTFRIALTTRDLKPPIINTSMKNALNSSRINTSKRQPGGGSGKTSPRSSPAVRSGGPVRPLVSAPPLPFPAAWSR
jgi:hypothetical protein